MRFEKEEEKLTCSSLTFLVFSPSAWRTSLRTWRAASCCGTGPAPSSARRTSSSPWTPWTACPRKSCHPPADPGSAKATKPDTLSQRRMRDGWECVCGSGGWRMAQGKPDYCHNGQLQTLNVLLFQTHIVQFFFGWIVRKNQREMLVEAIFSDYLPFWTVRP